MKNVAALFLAVLLVLIASCAKKEEPKTTQDTQIQQNQETERETKIEQAKEQDFRFVNSKEGLRIRNKPSTDGEKIGSLKNKEKVEVIAETAVIEKFGLTKARWLEIKTENNLSGFVFGGYLEETLEIIDIIQAVEGEYTTDTYQFKVLIEYSGNQQFLVSVYSVFSSDEPAKKFVKVEDIYAEDLFYSGIDGRGGIDGARVIKFDKDKNLIWQEDIYECDFDDDLNPINERESHETGILAKTPDKA